MNWDALNRKGAGAAPLHHIRAPPSKPGNSVLFGRRYGDAYMGGGGGREGGRGI